jgi:uncharacterized repeat protein (TIGR03803 family)
MQHYHDPFMTRSRQNMTIVAVDIYPPFWKKCCPIARETPEQTMKIKFHSLARSLAAFMFALMLFDAACGRAQPVVQTIMHSFANNPDGNGPLTTPVAGKTDGALYGVTLSGGANGSGTIWKINRDASGYKVLHSFTTTDGNGSGTGIESFVLQGSDNVLYGVTGGNPGIPTYGTVFKVNSDGNLYTVMHSFTNGDGIPDNLMQANDGALYGYAGSGNEIFKINTDGTGYMIFHALNSSTEGSGVNVLVQGSDGALYGTAGSGGANGHGTVFKLDTNGTFTVLHSFPNGTGDASAPTAGLVQASNGALYGTTFNGGSNSVGAVFTLNTDGSGYQVLHHFGSFTGDGTHPRYGSLVQGMGGVLFGTTQNGGANNVGTVFKMGLDGSGYNILRSFGTPNQTLDGANPYGGLVQGSSQGDTGVLYGTTLAGTGSGSGGAYGIVFALLVNPAVTITPMSNPAGSNGTVVFWPEWAFNYTLQMTTNVASTNWVTVSNAVPVVGAQVTTTNPAVYFRLIYR